MHVAKREDIEIRSDRQRQEFDPQAMEELKTSIETNQLMHAPVMRTEGGKLILVAGERRIKTMEDMWALGIPVRYNGEVIPEGHVPYVLLGELSPLEAEEAELDENLKRKDLTWQEHAKAVERLHKLRQAQQQQANKVAFELDDVASIVQTIKPHTVADTAKELNGQSDGGYADDIVRKEILVAKHLSNPEVAKAKDVKEAFKILKQQEQQAKNIELAKVVGASFNSDKHTLLNGDCLKLLADPKWQGYFDVILTDPPYGMGADDFGDGGGKLVAIEHHYNDSYENWQNLLGGRFVNARFSKTSCYDHAGWCELSFKVAKAQAHAYVFCDFDRFHELKVYMELSGWYVFRTPLILHKLNSGRVPLPDQGPRRQYETILYAIKGRKPVTHIYPDVLSAQGDDNVGHGAQKPVAAFINLLQRSVKPGDKILDAFCGTGPIFPAAHHFTCEAVGMEKSASSYGMSLKRLQELKKLEQVDLLGELEGTAK